MKHFLLIAITFLLLGACNQAPKQVTFADIEEEFNFPAPLTETSKKIILKRFGTTEAYRDFLVEKNANKKNSSDSDTDISYSKKESCGKCGSSTLCGE